MTRCKTIFLTLLLGLFMAINVKLDGRVFNTAYKPLLNNKKRFEVVYGGAGSGKSVGVAQKKVVQHLRSKGRTTLVVRKVGKTLRHSAFSELETVMKKWNLYDTLFKVNRSDLEIRRVDYANRFIFTGLDDVEKLKSISGITDIWIEEATELTKEDFLQLNLRLRGRTKFSKQITLTFNPVSALSWIKEYFFDTKRDDTSILKTTYRDNRFIDPEYKAQIERLAIDDPIYYKIYGLGEWGVLGDLVYTNYVSEWFDKSEFNFEQIHYGCDWGFNDPSVLIKVGYKDQEIYILDMIYVKGKTNSEFIELAQSYVNENGEAVFPKDEIEIIADSSEPARIKEWQSEGWNIRGANKKKNSLRHGIDFNRRHRVHIHPDCQPFLNEIQAYCYRKDKEGNVHDDPMDFHNHAMDAWRYSLEPLALQQLLQWA